MINNNIIPIVNSIQNLEELNVFKKQLKIGIHIDTGINRLGISINEINNIYSNNIEMSDSDEDMSIFNSSFNPLKKHMHSRYSISLDIFSFKYSFISLTGKPIMLSSSPSIFENRDRPSASI